MGAHYAQGLWHLDPRAHTMTMPPSLTEADQATPNAVYPTKTTTIQAQFICIFESKL